MPKRPSRKEAQNHSADSPQLSRRERQIMDVLYRLQRASAAEIWEAVPNRPTYTAIRTHLSLLEEKGHVKHEKISSRFSLKLGFNRVGWDGVHLSGFNRFFLARRFFVVRPHHNIKERSSIAPINNAGVDI